MGMLQRPYEGDPSELIPVAEGKLSNADTASGESSSFSEDDRLAEKQLLRKIDLHVLPMLFFIYVVAFLDRVNISNALTMSLPKDLGLTGQQPNVALCIFFVPYIIFEAPSNIMLKKTSPHIWLSLCITAFGIITIAQGFVQNYAGLLAVRFFLGLAEAGIFPGSFYVISFWYKRAEAQRRFTYYWTSLIIAGAFGGLLASGIANINGVRGLANWRWIFILEGIATVLVGIASYLFVSDFPSQAKWLTPKEAEIVRKRTTDDMEDAEAITVKDVLAFPLQPHAILGGLMYFSIVVPVYSLAYFTPTIIQALGYSVIQTQLHSVPPFAASLGLCLIMAFLSDKYNIRFPFVLFGQALLIIGLAILITVHGKQHFSIEYLGVNFTVMGGLGAGASIVCWYLMNLEGHKQRAIGSAWVISFGNIGGIVATFAFLKQDAPNYHTGYSILIAFAVLGTVSSILYTLLIVRDRRKAIASGMTLPSL